MNEWGWVIDRDQPYESDYPKRKGLFHPDSLTADDVAEIKRNGQKFRGAVDVFTDKELARTEANALNESAFMTGPDGKLVHANPWKVYELVEVE